MSASTTFQIDLKLGGFQPIQSGIERLKFQFGDLNKTLGQLGNSGEGVRKLGGALGQLGGDGAGAVGKIANEVGRLQAGLSQLSGMAGPLSIGITAAFAAASKAATSYFELLAEQSEALKNRLSNLYTPGTSLLKIARGVSSDEELTSTLADIGKEIDRLTARRQELIPQTANVFNLNAAKEMAAVRSQLADLTEMREKLTGSLGRELVAQNQTTAANKYSVTWLKAHGDATRAQITALEDSFAPMRTQVQLLTEEKRKLQELYVVASPSSPTGEKARLEIRRDMLTLDRQISDLQSKLAADAAREQEEAKRRVGDITREWQLQIKELDRVGETLKRNNELAAARQESLRAFVYGSTYAGAADNAYQGLQLSRAGEKEFGLGGLGDGALAGVKLSLAELGTEARQVGELVRGSIGGAVSGISGGIDGLIRGTMTWSDALRNVGSTILSSIVTSLSEVAARMAVLSGLRLIPGLGGLSAIGGLLPGFSSGGYTGSGGLSEVAGLVHRREYVFDAQSVERIGLPRLEAIHAGDPITGPEGGSGAGGGGGNSINLATFDSRLDARRWAESQDSETWFVDMAKRNAHLFRR